MIIKHQENIIHYLEYHLPQFYIHPKTVIIKNENKLA